MKIVNDVSHPSKTAATPTSRPIVVNHGPMIKDRTIKPTDDADDEEAKLAVAHKPDKVIEAPTDAKIDAKEESTEAADTEPEPEREADDDSSSDEAHFSQPSTTSTKKSDDVPFLSKEDQALQDAADKLIESKEFHLPIREAKRKRRTRIALLAGILVLVIGLVVADLLIDAGIIKTSIPPLANLIKN